MSRLYENQLQIMSQLCDIKAALDSQITTKVRPQAEYRAFLPMKNKQDLESIISYIDSPRNRQILVSNPLLNTNEMVFISLKRVNENTLTFFVCYKHSSWATNRYISQRRTHGTHKKWKSSQNWTSGYSKKNWKFVYLYPICQVKLYIFTRINGYIYVSASTKLSVRPQKFRLWAPLTSVIGF